MAGNAERQADDDHVGQGLARDVDSLPEAIGAEDHAVEVGLEGLDHFRPRQTVALGEEGDVPLGQPGSEGTGRGIEHLVRGEEHERLALGAFQVVGDRLDRDPLEVLRLVRGIGKVPGQVDGHLVGIIERASQRMGLGSGHAEPGLEEVELRRRAHAERRGGENAGGDLAEELLAQARADIQRSGRQANPHSRPLLQLDPVDLILGRLADPGRDLLGQGHAPGLRRGQLDTVLGLLDLGRTLADRRGQPAQLLAEVVGQVEGTTDPAVESRALPELPLGNQVEELVGGRTGVLDQVHGFLKLMVREQALPGPVVVEPRQRDIDADVRDLQPHVLAGHGLEGVGLVEDRDVVVGKEPEARGPQGEVAHEQGMVDDQQVGRPDASAGLEVEALLVPRTVAAQAIAVLALHGVPDAGQRPEIEVGAGAVGRLVGPELDLAELIELLLF